MGASTASAAPPAEAEAEADDDTREIVVTSPSETASATTIGAIELAAVPLRTAEDALRLAPGLVLVQHGAEGKGQQYFLRGFDAVHGIDFEVEVDGVPLNEWSNIHAQGYLDLGLLIPELIAEVEVLPGPFVLDQGPFALAGSARFTLGVPEPDRGVRASLGFGSTLRRRLVLSYSPTAGTGDGSRFVAAELMSDPGWGESRESRRAVVMTRQDLVARPRGRLGALVIGQVADFGLPGTIAAREYEAGRIGFRGAHDNGRGEAQRALVALDGRLRPSERHRVRVLAWSGYRRLELLENFTGFLERPEQGDRRVQRHRAVPFGLRVDHLAALGPRLELASGLGVRGEVFEQSEDRVDLQARPFERTRQAAAVEADVWLHSGVRWRPLPTLELGAGLRFDTFALAVRDETLTPTEAGGVRFAVSPRAHLRWSAVETLDLFAAYGRGFRPPEARAFTTFTPEQSIAIDDRTPDGGPATTASDSAELGLAWLPRRWLDLRLVGFATYLANESIYDHVSRTNLQLSATRRLGLEFAARTELTPWLHAATSLTWTDARFVESRNPVPLAPTLVGAVRAWLSHPIGARAGLNFIAWTPRPLPYGARGSTFNRLDATAGWHLERVQIDLAIENILNLEQREGEYYHASNFQRGRAASQLPTLHYVPTPPINARLQLTLIW